MYYVEVYKIIPLNAKKFVEYFFSDKTKREIVDELKVKYKENVNEINAEFSKVKKVDETFKDFATKIKDEYYLLKYENIIRIKSSDYDLLNVNKINFKMRHLLDRVFPYNDFTKEHPTIDLKNTKILKEMVDDIIENYDTYIKEIEEFYKKVKE